LLPSKVFPIQYSPEENQIYLIDWFARGIHMFRADDNTTIQATITPIVPGIEKHWGEFPCTITYELTPRSETWLNIDHSIRGLGTASCGPDTLDQYRLLKPKYEFIYTLELIAKSTS
jgi:hypothetical protein